MINSEYLINHYSKPYNVWVIDGFLKSEVNESILKDWPDPNSSVWHGGHKNIGEKENILETGMIAIDKREDIPNSSLLVLDYFHSENFKNIIEQITNIQNLIIDETRRWAGVRSMLKNSKQMIHSDADIHPESGLKKKLTLIYYLNKDYNRERDEGCLEIWDDNVSEKIIEIEPINNRLLIFEDSSKSYHGVPLVKSERKSIISAFLKKEETTDRSKALFVSRPQDSKKISELGLARSKI
jgi:Rps23 Pro-64 3,4-dihydroxylase Tpa1-like proline 4-hydroxylase